MLGTPIVRSMAVDTTEQYIYFGLYSFPLSIVKINASTGAGLEQQTHSAINGQSHELKIITLQNSSDFFILSSHKTLHVVIVCKYISTTSTTENCHNFTLIANFAQSQIAIGNEIFFTGIGTVSPYHLFMVKFTFGNTNADWTNRLACSIGTCGIGVSEATTSLDNSKIYNFFIYGSTTFLYFATLNFVDGAVVGSRYISSQVCTHVYGVALSGNYLAANTVCASYYLVLYNIPSASFVLKVFSLDYLFGITIEPTSGRFIEFGASSTLSYATKFSAENIDIHQDFTPSIILSLSALSPAIDLITSYTSAASNIASQTCSVSIPGTQSVSLILVSSTTSDVKFQNSDQSFSVIENNVLTVTPDLTCSSAGSTSIAYSIANCVGSTVPTWAIINSSTGLLTCTPPDVSVDTDFCMFILSTVAGVSSPIQKKIKVTVINCIALNCKTCSDLSSSVCFQCVSGYILSSGICIVASSSQTSVNGSSSGGNSSTSTANPETKETSKVLKTSSQSIVGATAVIITLTE